MSQTVELKRELNLFDCVNLIVSACIGSGLFILPGSVLEHTQSPALCLIIWIVSGLFAGIVALSFAELGARVTRSGAEYAYYMETFGPMHEFWGKIPAFAYSWTNVIVIMPASIAIRLLTCAEYTVQPILDGFIEGDFAYAKLCKVGFCLFCLVVITAINITSVKLYVKVQNVFSFAKILAAAIVILGGFYKLIIGETDNINKGFQGSIYDPQNTVMAMYSCLWVYEGFKQISMVVEEIKKPERNILAGLAIGISLVTGISVFMNVAYLSVLSKEEVLEAPAVAIAFGNKFLGHFSLLIPISVALSSFGAGLSSQFSVTRISYAAGQDGLMLESLSYIHEKRCVPILGILFQAFLAIIFILFGELTAVVEVLTFLDWIFNMAAMVSLFILRKKQKNKEAVYTVPTILPILLLVLGLFLVIVPIIQDPSPKYLITLAYILLGVLVQYWFVYKKHRPKYMDQLNGLVKKALKVTPTIPNVHLDNT